MGYNFYITRQDDFYDIRPEKQISLAEWKSYIVEDSNMQEVKSANVKVGENEILSYTNEALAVWKSYSQNGVNDNYAWFDYNEGNIVVKNPDEEIIAKMLEIAGNLNAKVVGEEGEAYPLEKTGSGYDKKPWWKFW